MGKKGFPLDCWEEDGVLYIKRDDLVDMLCWIRSLDEKVTSEEVLSHLIETLAHSPTYPAGPKMFPY